MQLDIVLRGQSNAAYLVELDQWAGSGSLTNEVQRLLGFDGVTNSVRLIYDRDGNGGDTVYPASAFLGDWMVRDGGGNWSAGRYEQGFLDRMAQYGAAGMGDATAMVWLHSEYDSTNAGLLPADWAAAVRTDAALVRAALGRDVPYHFVAAHPYGDGTDAGHQAIRAGMERLAADPAFDARIAARVPDLDVSLDDRDGNPRTTEYGTAHIDGTDAQIIATRLARSIAEDWAAFAQPASPVAAGGGAIASDGPRVVAAGQLDATRLQVDVVHDGAPDFGALSAVAAGGVGWSLRMPDGRRIEAVSAGRLDADSIAVGFAEPVPAGAVLDYAWGIGRVARPGEPGRGNAVVDVAGLPVWTPAEGVVVGAPATAPAAVAVAAPALPSIAAAPPTALDPEPALATGLARLAFGRPGSEGEVRSLQGVLEAGVGRGDVARALAESPWFGDRTAGLDDGGYAAALILDAYGRQATVAEVSAWEAAFGSGAAREGMAVALAETAEFAAVAALRAPQDAIW